MIRRIGSFTLCAIALAVFSLNVRSQSRLAAKANTPKSVPAVTVMENDRVRDGLAGPVRRVRTEIVKLSNESGKLLEGKHALLEVVAYDVKGNKTENQYFPIAGANLTGKEVYKYDDKGNISEMTLLNADGSLVSKETYKYDFDFAGNWNKMTTAVAVIEGGKMSFEPTEVTYRSIMYYLDENMMKMAQPSSPPMPAMGQQSSSNSVPGNVTDTKLENSTTAVIPKSPTRNIVNGNKKTSASLPDPVFNTAERLNSSSTLDLASARTTASDQAPIVNLDSEPPPAPAPNARLRPVSGGVLNGTAISLPAPNYPETARRLRMAGLVIVEVVVDETGKVISAVATSGPAQLREVAVQAARRARFSPTKLSGQPVKVAGLINYKFALSQ
ncbi:MAG TPA: energy transducer TonB [Pyrinomonadaceae bacterium]|nr:energy transducer TonB [Pyrinomonadaceae bacterium]